MKEIPNYYSVIPAEVRYDDNLKDKAKLLYGEISSLCNKDGCCYATNQYFANLYNVSKTTISTLIKELIDNGYLISEIEYKEGTKEIVNRYLRIIKGGYLKNFKGGYLKNFKGGIKENLKDNNINTNNTSINNNIYIVEKDTKKSEKKENLDDIYEIIDYLNLTIGSNYRHNTKSTITKIKARLNEGFSVEDFKKVINNKSQEWLGTEWEIYLRPETLFGTKFEQYLNQKSFNKKEKQLTQREKDDLFLKKIKEELKNE